MLPIRKNKLITETWEKLTNLQVIILNKIS